MTNRLPADTQLFGQLFLPKGGLRIQCPREYLFPDRLVHLVDQISFSHMHVIIFVF